MTLLDTTGVWVATGMVLALTCVLAIVVKLFANPLQSLFILLEFMLGLTAVLASCGIWLVPAVYFGVVVAVAMATGYPWIERLLSANILVIYCYCVAVSTTEQDTLSYLVLPVAIRIVIFIYLQMYKLKSKTK